MEDNVREDNLKNMEMALKFIIRKYWNKRGDIYVSGKSTKMRRFHIKNSMSMGKTHKGSVTWYWYGYWGHF